MVHSNQSTLATQSNQFFSAAKFDFPTAEDLERDSLFSTLKDLPTPLQDEYVFDELYLERVIADIERVGPGGKIIIAAFLFTNIKIADALAEAAKRGGKITITISDDKKQASNQVVSRLRGIEGVTINFKPTHEKIFIIKYDPISPPVGYFGSHNPTHQAVCGQQKEVSKIIHDQITIAALEEILNARSEKRKLNLDAPSPVKQKKRKLDDKKSKKDPLRSMNSPQVGKPKIYPSEQKSAPAVFSGSLGFLSQSQSESPRESQSPRENTNLHKEPRTVTAAWFTANKQMLSNIQIAANQHPNTRFTLMLDPIILQNREVLIELQALSEQRNLIIKIYDAPVDGKYLHKKILVIADEKHSFTTISTGNPTGYEAPHTSMTEVVPHETARALTEKLAAIRTLPLTDFLLKEGKKAKQQREARAELKKQRETQAEKEKKQQLELQRLEDVKCANNPYLNDLPYLPTPLLTHSSYQYQRPSTNPYEEEAQAELKKQREVQAEQQREQDEMRKQRIEKAKMLQAYWLDRRKQEPAILNLKLPSFERTSANCFGGELVPK